ncbi:hypothetical protein C8R43DRAFT_1234809 [Mycena crocata]|nr:hypothetical protein C8R43DRAFT_1234809 [Mycena crocata]
MELDWSIERDVQQHTDTDIHLDSDPQHTNAGEDPHLTTLSAIIPAVKLILAIRAGERTLQELRMELQGAHTHDIAYISQESKVARLRNRLDDVVCGLSVDTVAGRLSVPVDVRLYGEQLEEYAGKMGAWIAAHRGELDAMKKGFDEWRPPSPLEEGQVHPDVERASVALQRISARVRSLEPRPVDHPEEQAQQDWFKEQQQAQRRETQRFSALMDKFGFAELSEGARRSAIRQHVLRVVQEEIAKLTGKPVEVEDELFWSRPLGGMDSGVEDVEMLDELFGMEIDSYFDYEVE